MTKDKILKIISGLCVRKSKRKRPNITTVSKKEGYSAIPLKFAL